MSGSPSSVWLCLVGGMLLQLTYMILPLQRGDWARYLGSAALPLFMIGKADHDHVTIGVVEGLLLCGMFTLMFALLFQERLLPRLGEGVILMWTTVLLCMVVELGDWQSGATALKTTVSHLTLGVGFTVIVLLVVQRVLPYALKLAVYAWFLLVVVVMGVLQFRSSDFSLMIAGGTNELDYRFALIDGVSGAYVGVHAAFLYELLPIPGKGERWSDFKTRWRGYLDQVVSRIDDQQLNTPVALAIVLGIALLAYVNHGIGWMPDRTLASLVLFALPIVWQAASICLMRWRSGDQSASVMPMMSPTKPESTPREGIGRARHSRKHRQ